MMRSAAVPHGRVDGRRKFLPISPVCTVTGFPSLMQRGVAELFSHTCSTHQVSGRPCTIAQTSPLGCSTSSMKSGRLGQSIDPIKQCSQLSGPSGMDWMDRGATVTPLSRV